MRSKILKIAVILAVIAGAVFFIAKVKNRGSQDQNLQAMKDGIVADPIAKNASLTPDQIAQRLEQFKKAKEAVIASNFDSLQVVNQIALLKQQLGDFEGARIAWEFANIIRPKNSLSFANLAALYHFDLKQYDKAEKNYLISIANDPKDVPTIRNFFELYYYAIKDNVKAEAVLLKAIDQNPNAADLYSLLGSFYKETGNREKAILYFKKHLEMNPGNEAVKRELANLEKGA